MITGCFLLDCCFNVIYNSETSVFWLRAMLKMLCAMQHIAESFVKIFVKFFLRLHAMRHRMEYLFGISHMHICNYLCEYATKCTKFFNPVISDPSAIDCWKKTRGENLVRRSLYYVLLFRWCTLYKYKACFSFFVFRDGETLDQKSSKLLNHRDCFHFYDLTAICTISSGLYHCKKASNYLLYA
jgi:hypothetical protein